MKAIFNLPLRNILKSKRFSLINLAGLTIAFTVIIVLLYFVINEISFDRFNAGYRNIYRLSYEIETIDNVREMAGLHDYKLAGRLIKDIPQVENASSFRIGWRSLIKYESDTYDDRLAIVEPGFFEIFSFPVIAGDKHGLLEKPDEIVITRSLAEKLAAGKGFESMIGKSIELLNVKDRIFRVEAIIEDIPGNSSLRFDALINYENQRGFAQSSNDFGNSSIYIVIREHSDLGQVEKLISEATCEFYNSIISSLQSKEILIGSAECFRPFLEPLSSIYFNGSNSGYELSGKKSFPVTLSIIGFFILFTASINFFLLSTGQTLRRLKLIGLLKVFGGTRINIIMVFWIEVFILAIASIILGMISCNYLLPFSSQLLERNLDGSHRIIVMVALVIAFLLVGLTSLLIIPVYLKIKEKTYLLIAERNEKNRGNYLSNGFITVQYIISLVLIFSSLVIFKQTLYMKEKPTGMATDNILEIEVPSDFKDINVTLIKAELLENPIFISATSNDKGFAGNSTSAYSVANDKGEVHSVRIIRVDEDFVNTMQIELLDGDDFTYENLSGSNNSVIVNERFFEVIGMERRVGSAANILSLGPMIIRGIVKDFNYDPVSADIDPLILMPNSNYEKLNFLYVRFPEGRTSDAIANLSELWEDNFPGRQMRYSMLNDILSARYTREERWGAIIGGSAILAVIISSLGLFGLTYLMVHNKIREIGIRKVNGASIGDILLILNKRYLLIIAVSFLIASPIGYSIMNRWLQGFALKISIAPWIYACSFLIVLILSLLTVNLLCVSAAKRNPVEAIRTN